MAISERNLIPDVRQRGGAAAAAFALTSRGQHPFTRVEGDKMKASLSVGGVLVGAVAGLLLAAGPALGVETPECVPAANDAVYQAIIDARAAGQISQAQAVEASCRPSTFTDVASDVEESTTSPAYAPSAMDLAGTASGPGSIATITTAGSPVACRDVAKQKTSKNALGMTLIWHRTVVHWCWDRNFIITSGSSSQLADSPGWCWGYDGPLPVVYSGGKNYGYWDVTRGSKFSCAAGNLGFHRNLYAGLHVTGGGGAS